MTVNIITFDFCIGDKFSTVTDVGSICRDRTHLQCRCYHDRFKRRARLKTFGYAVIVPFLIQSI